MQTLCFRAGATIIPIRGGSIYGRNRKMRRMTIQQIELFILFGLILVFLLWGRFRHDLVAASGLLIAVVLGVAVALIIFWPF